MTYAFAGSSSLVRHFFSTIGHLARRIQDNAKIMSMPRPFDDVFRM
jgi:hypothetical protein